MKSYETRFKEGNLINQKWSEESAVKKFKEILRHAIENDNVYSIQQAHIERDIMHSTFYYLIDQYPVLDNIKKDLAAVIISRINKKGLEDDLNPTMSIWRMKQLGEKDNRYSENKNENKNSNFNHSMTEEEVKDTAGKLESEY